MAIERIQSVEQLRKLYGYPKGAAKDKQLCALEAHSINFIEHSPFLVISTHSQTGLVDCSPRGGNPGFVKILGDKRILIPDSKGNNRLDSLVNIVQTGNIACLFMIPGIDETLRVNGQAHISTSAQHLRLFSNEKKRPRACIEITINELFLHCAKALMRSELWSPESKINREDFPTMGKMLNDQLSTNTLPESQEEMLKRYQQSL